jgi:hypothetical protein
MPDESTAPAQPFKIVSVQRTKPPTGVDGAIWHHYVIMQGSNTIHGYRQGNHDAVASAVEEIVAKLNERRNGKRGRVQLVTTRRTNVDKRP